MRRLPGWALKVCTVLLTVLATVASTSYVGGHVKGEGAPLRPSLKPDTGQVNLAPGMRTTTSQPVTEVYVS